MTRSRYLLALPFALVGLLLLACGGDESNPPAAPTITPGSCNGSGIASIPRDKQRTFSAAPERIIDQTKGYKVTMDTRKGVIVLELDARNAPNTVNNFVFLSCHGFYDGLVFHRVVKTPDPFVIQGGDPLGNGQGGPGYTFDNEISPNLNHDTAGVISMARTAVPNTNGSQFFITLGPASFLNGQYNAFGKVTSGQDVVNAIGVGDVINSVSIDEH